MIPKTFYNSKLYRLMYRQVDISGLAVVRMLFGAIIMYEAWRYTDLLRIVAKFTQQDFYFKFRFFDWVEPLSTLGMQWVFIAYGIAGLCIFLGIFYHAATLAAATCISYIFLVEATNYLNHFYLVIIMSTLMFFIPAHKGWSLYAWFRPHKRQSTVPGWAVWLLRSELFIVYLYAAVAKMNVDWINGMPLYDWIGSRATATGFESILHWPMVIYFFTYAGLFYDLIVGPLLLFKRTRAIGYCLSLSFHLTNYYLFNIGIFPWFMIATTTIFFDTRWPRNLLHFFWANRFKPLDIARTVPDRLNVLQQMGLLSIAIHVAFQIGFPLRHFAYPTYVSWSEEGHNFAWHMKLRGKNGTASFTIRDPKTGETYKVDPKRYLTQRQTRKMATRPALMIQFAHYLRDLYTLPGEEPVEVYAETKIKVNGRKSQRLADPTVNLAVIDAQEFNNEWLMPLRQPVWNALNKKNRFGPAFKKDAIAIKAIHKYTRNPHQWVQKP